MTTDNTPKQKALDLALKQIEKQFGKGSIMRLGDAPIAEVEVIPTGSLALDAALGVGGIPRGRVTEIFGPESSGKTTLAIHCIAEAQKLGGICAFIDAEHAFDPTYAGNLGVDIDNLLMSQPDTGEQALSICEMLIRSGARDLIVDRTLFWSTGLRARSFPRSIWAVTRARYPPLAIDVVCTTGNFTDLSIGRIPSHLITQGPKKMRGSLINPS